LKQNSLFLKKKGANFERIFY